MAQRYRQYIVRLMGPDDEDRPDDEEIDANCEDFSSQLNSMEATISSNLDEGWYVKVDDVPSGS